MLGSFSFKKRCSPSRTSALLSLAAKRSAELASSAALEPPPVVFPELYYPEGPGCCRGGRRLRAEPQVAAWPGAERRMSSPSDGRG